MEFLSSLDLFCVPTTYAEPKGLFLLEAAALGLKYVAPDHGAFPELHQRLQHGWLYQHDSMSDLIGTLEQACDTRPARENPSDRTLREIDIETHAERLWRVLNA
jgi:glycosyltransferase involved in cell wall biosynthesis